MRASGQNLFKTLRLTVCSGADHLHVAITRLVDDADFGDLQPLRIDDLYFITRIEHQRHTAAGLDQVSFGVGREGIEAGLQNTGR